MKASSLFQLLLSFMALAFVINCLIRTEDPDVCALVGAAPTLRQTDNQAQQTLLSGQGQLEAFKQVAQAP